MFKTVIEKEKPWKILYHDSRQLNQGSYKSYLKKKKKKNQNSICTFKNAEITFLTVSDQHAPKISNVLRGNHEPHVYKDLCKAIMKGSQLKAKANKKKPWAFLDVKSNDT